jgi:hypothetical protein
VIAAAGGGAAGTRTRPRELREGLSGEDIRDVEEAFRNHQQASDQFAADNRRIRDAENQLALARATTSTQRLAILRRELATTTDRADRLRIQAQIEQEQHSAAKSHTTELGKQLGLEEKIRDAKEQQLKAALDAAELTIRDRQERRKEDQDLRQAQRIIASGRASAEFKAAAQDKIDLINIERQKRALEISEKAKTAGGQIIGGRVFQSRASGGTAVGTVPVPTGVPTIAPSQLAAAGGGGAAVVINFNLDGKTIASQLIPDIFAALGVANRQSLSAGSGGRP